MDSRLRFVFGGRQLEIGRPVRTYGISKGSNIHLTALLKSERVQARLALNITTPFAEASGVLKLRNSTRVVDGLPCCLICPEMTRSLSPDRTPSRWSACGCHRGQSLHLVLHSFHPFSCIINYDVNDMWQRMRTLPARLVVRTLFGDKWDVEHVLTGKTSPLLLPWNVIGKLHMSISLLTDQEQAADDVMEKCVELEWPSEEQDECCICLQPMMPGQITRRLPCFHRLHAGCAMVHDGILRTQRCPLCRCSIFATQEDMLTTHIEELSEDLP